jgi:integrase
MPLYHRPGSPHWWVRISIAGEKTRRSTGTADRGAAEEFEQRERDRLWRFHKLGDGAAVRFREVAQRWLNETTKRTRDKDEAILAWMCEEVGDEPISALDRDAVEELRKIALDTGKSKSTVDRHMALLRAVLNACENSWSYAGYHAPKVPMYGKSAQTAKQRFLRPEELERLCKELPPHLALAARFAALTGLRMRAMLGLTWDRVDLKSRRLWIPGEQMKGAAPHGLPLSTVAIKVLRQLKKLNHKSTDVLHVFQWNDKPMDDCNGHAFKNAVQRAGLSPLRWHDLRHTFASWALQQGVTLPELKELGGWKSFDMVLNYAHLAPDHLAKAAEKVGTIRAQRIRAKSTTT